VKAAATTESNGWSFAKAANEATSNERKPMIDFTVETESLVLGTRLGEVHRAPGGKEFASRVGVSEYEPARVFALHMLEGALPLDPRIIFDPTAEGRQIRFRVHGQPNGAMRLAQPLLRRSLKRQFARDCTTLKQVLESVSTTSDPAS
jgi:hypothetical protein